MFFLLAALAAAQPAAAARNPVPDQPLGALLADSDYPAGAIQRGASGMVRFRLDVGADGAPTRCTITAAVDPELDRATCDLFMARAHFQPARDASGRAVAGSIVDRVMWELPGDDRKPPFASYRTVTVISLDARGNISCAVGGFGTAPTVRPEEDCGFLAGSGAAQAMRARAIPGDLIMIFTLTPVGAAAAPGNEEAGAQLTYEDTAHLVIAPDGAVLECQPGTTHILQTPLPMRLPTACVHAGRGVVLPANGQEVRRADTASRLYFRRRPG